MDKRVYLLVLSLGVISLAGCSRLTQSQSIDITGDQMAETSEEIANPEPTSADTLVVTEINSGTEVVVSEVSLSKTGFVVVVEDDNGIPGEVIGQSLLMVEGVVNGLQIKLDRRIQDEVIYVQMYHDDGDGELDTVVDAIVLDENGNRIQVQRIVGEIPFMEADMPH